MIQKLKFDKLVRDKNGQRLEKKGAKIILHENLDEKTVQKYYALKIVEEAQEVFEEAEKIFSNNENSKEKLLAELADLYEILDGFCKKYKISSEEITAARAEKSEYRGTFDDSLIINYIIADPDDPQLGYFKDNPKYPEIA